MTKNRIVIGVSKLSENYASWLGRLHNGLEIIDFYTMDFPEIASRFPDVSGLLLSGGGDIDPGLYGRNEDLSLCRGIDARRDRTEASLIELAFSFKIPILGICRGLQMINVAREGTLVADIPTFIKGSVIHQGNEGDVFHSVKIDQHSRLFDLTRTKDALVNSSHHQAIRETGRYLQVSAMSDDGIIEAIELDSSRGYDFCIAVQWHPERMDLENPLSGLLGKGFIEAASGR
jgi:putative glutamine amidotransferase